MCSRYTYTKDEAKLKLRDQILVFGFVPRGDIRPTDLGPVIIPAHDSFASRQVAWGWRVPWDKQPLINAKSETITQLPTFKPHLQNRCLILADGFFEKGIRFIQPGELLFAMAGLWQPDAAGDRFTMLTTTPNASVSPYHHRMPFILRAEQLGAWLGDDWLDDWEKVQAIVLADENRQAVIDVINKTKEFYQDAVGRGKHAIIPNDEPWNVPEIINYDLTFVKKKYKRSIIQPHHAKVKGNGSLPLFEEDSDVEIKFIEYLEKAKQVKWWFKNGKQDATYFAVPYVESGVEKLFYVDFVVMLTDGRIGLFDTKGGIFAKTAKERAEGLVKYIETESKKSKKLFGGIVVTEQNSWRINDGKKYTYDPDNLGKDWKFLDLD